jgi:hypothetical protein
MSQAKHHTTTKLWTRFCDPYLRAVFRAAEDDGLSPSLVETDHPRTLDGGAAEVIGDTGRRVRVLEEV